MNCQTKIEYLRKPRCQYVSLHRIRCDADATHTVTCNGDKLGDYCHGHAHAIESEHHEAGGGRFHRPLWDSDVELGWSTAQHASHR